MNWSNIHCTRRRGTNAEISLSLISCFVPHCSMTWPQRTCRWHKRVLFFFFLLFDLVAPFSGLDFSLSQCDLLSASSSLWNSLLLLFPWGDGEQITQDLLPQSCAHFLRWCCWAFRGAGLSQQTHLTAACVHFSHSSYDPIQCGSCLQEWTSTVTRCWKGPPYLLDQPYENPFYIQIFICSHEKIKADPLQSPEALDNRGW